MKKATSAALCLAFALAMSIPVGAAFASNWRDEYYSISSSGHGYTWTPSREKQDYSSSWNQCTWANAEHSAQIGAQSKNGGTVYFVSPRFIGKADYMLNNVRENNYHWVTLWISGKPDIAAGYWSPDSI